MTSNWKITLIVVLLLTSALLYTINYIVYHDPTYMGKLVTMQMAAIPITTILVTLFLNRVITSREQQARRSKLNMIIGSFFSEVGRPLLSMISAFDSNREKLKDELDLGDNWTKADFLKATAVVKELTSTSQIKVQLDKAELKEIHRFLAERRLFLQGMVQNPALLERDSFADMLLAVFHLAEEMDNRINLDELSDIDYAHLSSDMKRAYSRLLTEWLGHSSYLKGNYSYLYSLVVRNNPLKNLSSAEVH